MKKKVHKKEKYERVIALTGANGFIGSNLAHRIQVDPRYKLVVLDIKKPDFLHKSTKFYKIDLTEPTVDATIADILKNEHVDTFVHLAFLTNPCRNSSFAHELEVIGTMQVLHACAEVKVKKFILGSTTMVYGAQAMNPNFLTEDMPLCQNSNYNYVKDKVEAEQLVERFRRKNPDTIVTVLRPCWILGPTIQNYLTRYLYSPVIITLLGYDPLFQLVHEEDVIDAFRLAIEGDHPGIFNIVGRGVLPLSTLLKLAGKINLPLLHVIAYPLVDALWAAGLFGAPSGHLDFIRYIWVADGEKAEKELGFTPKYSTKETLNHFIGIQRLREIKLI